MYRQNEGVRDAVNCIFALPFVPVADVVSVFNDLRDDPNLPAEVEPLYTYFESTYVTGTLARGRRRATPPRYALMMWNHYLSTLEGFGRSNNHSEAWNAKFTKMIVTNHSNIWKFIEYIKKDQRDNEQIMIQLATGHTNVRHPVRRSYVQNQNFITTVVRQYDTYRTEGNVNTYLKSIAYRLKRPNVEEEDNEEEEQQQ